MTKRVQKRMEQKNSIEKYVADFIKVVFLGIIIVLFFYSVFRSAMVQKNEHT